MRGNFEEGFVVVLVVLVVLVVVLPARTERRHPVVERHRPRGRHWRDGRLQNVVRGVLDAEGRDIAAGKIANDNDDDDDDDDVGDRRHPDDVIDRGLRRRGRRGGSGGTTRGCS